MRYIYGWLLKRGWQRRGSFTQPRGFSPMSEIETHNKISKAKNKGVSIIFIPDPWSYLSFWRKFPICSFTEYKTCTQPFLSYFHYFKETWFSFSFSPVCKRNEPEAVGQRQRQAQIYMHNWNKQYSKTSQFSNLIFVNISVSYCTLWIIIILQLDMELQNQLPDNKIAFRIFLCMLTLSFYV